VSHLLRSTGVVVFASLLAFGVAGCGKNYTDKVVGVWEWKVGGGTLIVTNNKDGSGSIKGPAGEKKMTWRVQRGNNFIFNDGGKDSGFVIDTADENTIQGTDPQAPGQKIIWTRKT
jgi:hypothetical protein